MGSKEEGREEEKRETHSYMEISSFISTSTCTYGFAFAFTYRIHSFPIPLPIQHSSRKVDGGDTKKKNEIKNNNLSPDSILQAPRTFYQWL